MTTCSEPSGCLKISDPGVALGRPEDGALIFTVVAGDFPVYVRIIDVADPGQPPHLRNARLAVLIAASLADLGARTASTVDLTPDGEEDAPDGEHYGVGVDTATVGFADADAAARMPEDEQERDEIADSWWDLMEDATSTPRYSADIPLPNADRGENLICCMSGWGDGFYAVTGSVDASGTLLAVHVDFGVEVASSQYGERLTAVPGFSGTSVVPIGCSTVTVFRCDSCGPGSSSPVQPPRPKARTADTAATVMAPCLRGVLPIIVIASVSPVPVSGPAPPGGFPEKYSLLLSYSMELGNTVVGNIDAVPGSVPGTPPVITAEEQARIHRRTLRVVILSQILGGAGLAAGISVGALLAQDMLGSDSLAGLPTGLFTLGSAAAAFLVGRSTRVLGRRLGLAAGFTAGGLGAVGVVVAAVADSVPLLFISLFIYGAGTATNLQTRYAGSDLAPAEKRGHGTSMAMVATTVGAVAGPNLIDPLGHLADNLGIPTLAGPFLLAAVAYLAAGVTLFLLLRPDPYLLARQIAGDDGPGGGTGPVPKPARGAWVGAATMTMTPVHMRAHDHGMGAVGLVIGLHVASMWLPSLVTGRLVDSAGRVPVAVAAGVTLLAAGLTAALAPADSLVLLIVALMLLGLGWNLGLVSGTAMVVDATVPANRPQTQGTVDVGIALSGAVAGLASGAVMTATSYQILGVIGGVLSLLLIPALRWGRQGVRR
ncbi:MFS transporter [Corynebacterium variabile]|uniref:MFS transporter n=1 Tax=Corynebacterium variabile TaxID=1727 RepID=UPI003F97C6D3